MRRDCGLEGPSNFRDLGGYRAADGRIVRWRRIFRSDALRLTDADVAVLRDEIGLRLVIDLRTGFEFGHRDGGGNENYVRRNLAVGAQRVHLPMVDETRIQRQASDERPIAARSYLKMFERGGPALAEAFSLIAEPDNHPLVFHCAAGKDRTGILAAMLLGLLGVDDDTIVADYALSQANMARALEKIRARPDAERILAHRPPASFEAPVEALIGFVEAVRATYGTWEEAAPLVGLGGDGVKRLRELLLTD
ncbi:MAG: tyrosine-protein phosphatase [Acidimicrobiia bacterium]